MTVDYVTAAYSPCHFNLCPIFVHADAAMSPKITGELLRQLRQVMRNCKYFTEPIQAYIVPSGDAHQVNKITHTQTQLKAKYVICASCLSHFVTVLFFWSFPLTFEINCNPLLPLHTRDLMWEEQLDGIGNDWLVVSHFKLIVNEADLSLSLSLFLPLSLCLCLCVV